MLLKKSKKPESEPTIKLLQGDCIATMKSLPGSSVDLCFADPPFNIGYQYNTYSDNKEVNEYLSFSEKWIYQVWRLLKPNGSFYLAIGDEFAAHLYLVAKLYGFHMRNWIIWHYTFGQQTSTKFARCKTHIFYFVKSEVEFTFNADAIKVPSARQEVYGDKRAAAGGKIPPDVWIESRLCGTFKERTGHPCQMPETILTRIISASSYAGDLVLDPFLGSGTTGVAAKRLRRKFIGIELDELYFRKAKERIGCA